MNQPLIAKTNDLQGLNYLKLKMVLCEAFTSFKFLSFSVLFKLDEPPELQLVNELPLSVDDKSGLPLLPLELCSGKLL